MPKNPQLAWKNQIWILYSSILFFSLYYSSDQLQKNIANCFINICPKLLPREHHPHLRLDFHLCLKDFPMYSFSPDFSSALYNLFTWKSDHQHIVNQSTNLHPYLYEVITLSCSSQPINDRIRVLYLDQ